MNDTTIEISHDGQQTVFQTYFNAAIAGLVAGLSIFFILGSIAGIF